MSAERLPATRYLTPKRERFLEHFRNYVYITTTQAYTLTSATSETQRRATRRFLLKLYQAGYVLRTPVYTAYSPVPHYEFSYRLSKHGAKAVLGASTTEKTPYSLDHDREITQFHIELAQNWNNGSLYWQQRNLKKTVYPDALFAVSRDGVTAHYCFLEVEKSRAGHYRSGESGLEAKLKRYAQYRKTIACKRDWMYFDDFRVVVVMRNEKRRLNLLQKLRTAVPHHFVWITTEDLYRDDILDQIFLTPSDFGERAHSLLEL